MRLLGKCLHAGVLDGQEYSDPDEGTAQGSIISPLFGNVYLHYVLDLWFERDIKPRLKGRARLIRYADDFIIGFEKPEDAERVLAVLHKRMAKYGLTLHPEKTCLIPFERPRYGQKEGSGSGTFDFLGLTMYWRKSRRGGWYLGMETRKAKVRKFLLALGEWCRRHRHLSLKDQHAALSRRLRGHFRYFGVNGNSRKLEAVLDRARRIRVASGLRATYGQRAGVGRQFWEVILARAPSSSRSYPADLSPLEGAQPCRAH